MSITPNNPADFTPEMGNYKELTPFRFWCQKVLPLVYDDSLSYYELLNKVVQYLNVTMEDVTTLDGDVTNLHTAYVQLQEYVNDYFESLDVQEEINNKLDEMAENGELSELLYPLLPPMVAEWLAEHITPTTPSIDNTLSVSGAGADSKTVGNNLSVIYSNTRKYNVNELCMYNGKIYRCIEEIGSDGESWDASHWSIVDINTILSILYMGSNQCFNMCGTLINKTFINYNNGLQVSFNDEKFNSTDYIRVVPRQKIIVSDYRNPINASDLAGLAFYTKGKSFISGVQYVKPNAPILLTVPDNAYYMRATYFSDTGSNIKIFGSNFNMSDIALIGNASTFNALPDAPYNNANTIPIGTICTYVGLNSFPSNIPDIISSGATKSSVITIITVNYFNGTLGGSVQTIIGNRVFYIRYADNESNYGNWRRLEYEVGYASNNANNFVAPFNDCDTIPRGTIMTYIGYDYLPAHRPQGTQTIATVITLNYNQNNKGGAVQFWFDKNNGWFRLATSESSYQPWVSLNSAKQAIHEESVFSLFPNVGVIGDSYASGALTLSSYSGADHYAISWPQIIARKCGINVTNFSKGGLTTKTWLTSDKGLALLNSESAKDLYVLTLGINDNASGGLNYLGSVEDIGTDNDTFYGNYAKIIDAIIEKAPNAKIVISTLAPTSPGSYVTEYNTAITNIATHYNIPILVQGDDVFFTSEQYINNIRYNHPMANGYVHMANAFDRMLCKAMDSYINYFANFGLYL